MAIDDATQLVLGRGEIAVGAGMHRGAYFMLMSPNLGSGYPGEPGPGQDVEPHEGDVILWFDNVAGAEQLRNYLDDTISAMKSNADLARPPST